MLAAFSAKTEQNKTKILLRYSKFDLNVIEKHQITKLPQIIVPGYVQELGAGDMVMKITLTLYSLAH